ncbi:MAG: hypothetical protein R3C42_02450 [Parvularculaceae bacterium]
MREEKAGIIAPRLGNPDGTPQISAFRFHSPLSEFLSAAQTGPLDKLFAFAVVPVPVSNAPIACDWASFACVLIRREAINETGLMDDSYFMYFRRRRLLPRAEEIRMAGRFTIRRRVVHLRSGSSPVKASMKAKRARPPIIVRRALFP